MANAEDKNPPTRGNDPQEPTQDFSAHHDDQSKAFQPSDPYWLGPPPAPRRRRTPLVLAGIIGAAVLLAIGLVVGVTVGGEEDTEAADQQRASNNTNEQPAGDNAAGAPAGGSGSGAGAGNAGAPAGSSGSGAGAGNAAPGGGSEFDLRNGSVFLQSNDPTNNEVVAFSRSENGKLREVGRYETGGVGSGSFEDTSNGLVLGSPSGEASPQHNLDSAQLLFVTNAGSNTVSVFRVNADNLELVDTIASGGEKPVSLTVNRGLLYVLNSGELDDRFILRFPDQFLDNCAHGEQPTVTGFRISNEGDLSPLPNSTRPISGGQESGCAQVSFTPDGTKLMVTERLASLPQRPPDKGAIVTFEVSEGGQLGTKRINDTSGVGPFGFGFAGDGTVLVTEQDHAEEGRGTASSYTMLENGEMKAVSKAVPTRETDTCWIVSTNDGRLAFASSALGSGAVSSFRIDDTGGLRLLHSSASAPDGRDKENDRLQDGNTDLSLSRDSKYLYQLNSHFGTLDVFRVNSDGKLSHIEEHKVFNVTLPENGGQLTPFGISAF